MFTRKLAKITGTLKKYEYEMYDEQRLNNPGMLIYSHTTEKIACKFFIRADFKWVPKVIRKFLWFYFYYGLR